MVGALPCRVQIFGVWESIGLSRMEICNNATGTCAPQDLCFGHVVKSTICHALLQEEDASKVAMGAGERAVLTNQTAHPSLAFFKRQLSLPESSNEFCFKIG